MKKIFLLILLFINFLFGEKTFNFDFKKNHAEVLVGEKFQISFKTEANDKNFLDLDKKKLKFFDFFGNETKDALVEEKEGSVGCGMKTLSEGRFALADCFYNYNYIAKSPGILKIEIPFKNLDENKIGNYIGTIKIKNKTFDKFNKKGFVEVNDDFQIILDKKFNYESYPQLTKFNTLDGSPVMLAVMPYHFDKREEIGDKFVYKFEAQFPGIIGIKIPCEKCVDYEVEIKFLKK